MIPAERLGALLSRSRTRRRRTLAEIARRIDGWTPSGLAAIERGSGVDEPALVGELLGAYGVGRWRATGVVPALVLDRSVVTDGEDPCELREAALRLAALGEVWGTAPDAEHMDTIVAEWSGADCDHVGEARATALADRDDLERWIDDTATSLVVPAAGIAIGTTHVGSLALVVPVATTDDGSEKGGEAPLVTLGELRTIRSSAPLRT